VRVSTVLTPVGGCIGDHVARPGASIVSNRLVASVLWLLQGWRCAPCAIALRGRCPGGGLSGRLPSDQPPVKLLELAGPFRLIGIMAFIVALTRLYLW
jgi:hypothetical protein